MQKQTRLYTTDYAPSRGGVARYLGNLAAYFSVEASAEDPEGLEGIDVIVLDPSTRWWQALRRFLRDRSLLPTLSVGSKLVVSHVLPIGTAALAFKWMTGTRYVVVVHGMDVGLAKTRWTKRIVAGMVLRGAEVIVANSKALEREVREEFGVKRTVVAYPTVEIRRPPPTSPRPTGLSSGRASHEEGKRVRLLTVARLVPRKGHLRVLDAIALLRRDHPDLPVSYEIVGDGPHLETITRRISELRLEDRVAIVRDVTDDQLASHYAAADIFVEPVVANPVDREGFGIVYLEAALHGVPSIATDMPGVDEAVIDGTTGILVKDGDIAALADAVYRLATNEDERQRLGQAAYRRAVEEFTAKRQFEPLRRYLLSTTP